MSTAPQADAPLAGIRVLDFTQNLPGPYTTMILRALGAEVIKVEPPRGDVARLFSRLFEIVNAGKKSLVLDLKDPAAARTIQRLITEVDVLVEGFRPGVMARLGCDETMARRLNPRLVYCSISGFGQEGPYRDYPGHDLNFQALTGVCHMLRDENDRPLGAALPIGDLSASMTAVSAILAALVARGRTGEGRVVDVAMVDALLSWVYVWAEGLTPSDARLSSMVGPTARALRRTARKRGGLVGSALARVADALSDPSSQARVDALGERLKTSKRFVRLTRLRLHALPHYTIYRTADDRWLSVGIVDEDKFWRALCDALGLQALGRIPLLGRFAAAGVLRKAVARAIRRHSLEYWLQHVDRTRVPIAPVLTVDEALQDPQLRQRRLDPQARVHAPWPLMGRLEQRAPRLGEHNEELLATLRDSA